MTEPTGTNGSDDSQLNQSSGLCKLGEVQLLPKSKPVVVGSLIVLVILFSLRQEHRTLKGLASNLHGGQIDEAIVTQYDVGLNERNENDNNSSRPTSYLMYVMTLQGVEGAGKNNDGRYDQFQRHWSILCNQQHHNSQERIHFHKCPGTLSPKRSPDGWGLSVAFLDCFRWALKHHKQWHMDHNPTNATGPEDDSIPYVFLEDDARLYNPNFCYSEYRSRIWKKLPQTNATLLMLGGHNMGFYDDSHPIAKAYQDHYYNESILMDPSALPEFLRPRRGFGSYGFALLNTPTVEYMTRKMTKMLNRTFDHQGLRGWKAIDQQFHHYGVLKTVMSYPWLVYHEGGLHSNTKGMVRGEFGDGSKQYRWVDGLTGSAQNCTSKDSSTSSGKKKQANSIAAKSSQFQEGTVEVSCRTITFRIPNTFSTESNSTFDAEKKKKIPIAIVSRSNNLDMRASIRSTWGKHTDDKFFLVAGPWQEVVSEFQEHGDLVWLDLSEEGNGDNADASSMLSTLQVASFLVIAERQYGDRYSDILKVTDHSYANLGAIRSQLADKGRQKIAIWGSNCGTGVRPHHVGVPEAQYSDYFFPQYCKGEGYALSRFFVQCAVGQIPYSKLVSLDDAYIGILGERCWLQENEFHSVADVEKDNIPLLHHGLKTAAAMEEFFVRWSNVTVGSKRR